MEAELSLDLKLLYMYTNNVVMSEVSAFSVSQAIFSEVYLVLVNFAGDFKTGIQKLVKTIKAMRDCREWFFFYVKRTN